jgi:hypothetical protein
MSLGVKMDTTLDLFKNVARVWLEGRTGINYDDTVLNELVDDLALVLMEVYEAGWSCGYDEGLEENLTELQW